MGNLGFQELLLIVIIACSICVIPFVFYLITLQKALKTVSPENRKMEPGLVWLLFIPLFSAIWMFFVADAVGTSFKKEFDKHGVFQHDKPTYNLGLTLAILQCCSIIPILGGIAALASLVIWIIYWVQVNQKTNELLSLARTHNLEPGETSIFV